MNNTDTLFDEARNTGMLDRVIRIAVGSVAILAVLTSQNTGMLGSLALIPLFAIYPIMTGLIAYDPFYAWIGINTNKSSVFSDEHFRKFLSNMTGEEFSNEKENNNHQPKSGKPHRDAA